MIQQTRFLLQLSATFQAAGRVTKCWRLLYWRKIYCKKICVYGFGQIREFGRGGVANHCVN